MKLLLDAHALIWAMDSPGQLTKTVRDALSDRNNDLLLSACTIWEISIKVGLGKLKLTLPFRSWIETTISKSVLPNSNLI